MLISFLWGPDLWQTHCPFIWACCLDAQSHKAAAERRWERPQWMSACALTRHAGRKMRVYQSEEAHGSPQAHAVFLEPGQVAEQCLSTEEPRPLELSGPTRAGLEGPERRRFSASELMTRLHSSLRLGRNSAARALTQGSGTGATREGTCSSPWP